MRLRLLLTACLLAILLVIFGCGGGGNPRLLQNPYQYPPGDNTGGATNPPGPPPSGGQQGAEVPASANDFLSDVVAPALPPTSDPATATLSGKVQVTGLTLLEPVRAPLQAGGGAPLPPPTAPGSRLPYLSTRIIDDEDNIGDAEYPTPAGLFSHTALPPSNVFNLALDGSVLEDINGDSVSDDAINYDIPVVFAPGKTTSITISIAPVEAFRFLIPEAAADVAAGRVIELSYTYSGPEGQRVKRQATNFRTGRIVVDSNGDGIYQSSDISGPDVDRNGIVDPAGQNAPMGMNAPPPMDIRGVVMENKPGRLVIIPDGQAGRPTTVLFDTRTAILAPDGRPIPPDKIKPGSIVLARGFFAPDDVFVALTIIAFPPDAAGMGRPGG